MGGGVLHKRPRQFAVALCIITAENAILSLSLVAHPYVRRQKRCD